MLSTGRMPLKTIQVGSRVETYTQSCVSSPKHGEPSGLLHSLAEEIPESLSVRCPSRCCLPPTVLRHLPPPATLLEEGLHEDTEILDHFVFNTLVCNNNNDYDQRTKKSQVIVCSICKYVCMSEI